jgi:hypothetical protein
LISVIVLGANGLEACVCATESIARRVALAEFVARIAIDAVRPDSTNENFHHLEFRVLELFKGDANSRPQVLSRLATSCAFLPGAGTEWLVFANLHQERLAFGRCSGSMQLDRKPDPSYPRAFVHRQESAKRRLRFLRSMRELGVVATNPYGLSAGPRKDCLDDQVRGLKAPEGDFAIYEFKVAPDLTVTQFRKLKGFSRRKIDRRAWRCVQSVTRAYKYRTDRIPEETEIAVALFYYAGQDEYPSFVSPLDL